MSEPIAARFKRLRKERRLFKMIIAANRDAEQAYRLGDYKYGDWLFKRAQQLAAEYDKLRSAHASNQLDSGFDASKSGENTENITSKGDIHDFVASELRGDAE